MPLLRTKALCLLGTARLPIRAPRPVFTATAALASRHGRLITCRSVPGNQHDVAERVDADIAASLPDRGCPRCRRSDMPPAARHDVLDLQIRRRGTLPCRACRPLQLYRGQDHTRPRPFSCFRGGEVTELLAERILSRPRTSVSCLQCQISRDLRTDVIAGPAVRRL